MDLTKYLQPSNKINSPTTRNTKRQALYKNQSKIGANTNRRNRENQLAMARKESRGKQLQNRRGIEEILEDDGNCSILDPTKSINIAEGNDVKVRKKGGVLYTVAGQS